MQLSSERRQLTLHPLAIHTFIKAQAGSLGKAIAEAVMNSVDAFATSVHIKLHGTGFSITDDGQGFKTRDEIEAWFETLGFPHDEGNHRTYGKFGMGRAQMWAFAKTIWKSNNFQMSVDVRNKGLDYDLEEMLTSHAGTSIAATFYDELPYPNQVRVEQEIAALVKYAPIEVTLNGKNLSVDPSAEEWDIETAQAWMRFSAKQQTLDVYNGGILVSQFHKYRYGQTGVIVTKTGATLSLNLARNDILVAECLVWKTIIKSFPNKKQPIKKEPRPTTTDEKKKEVADSLRDEKICLSDAFQIVPDLFRSVSGHRLAVHKLQGNVLFSTKANEVACRINKLKLACVVDLDVLTTLQMTPEELKAKLLSDHFATEGAYRKIAESWIWTCDPSRIAKGLTEQKTIRSYSELTEQSQVALQAWRAAFKDLQNLSRTKKLTSPTFTFSVEFGDAVDKKSWWEPGSGLFVLREKEAVAAVEGRLPETMRYLLAALQSWEDEAPEGVVPSQQIRDWMVDTPLVGDMLLTLRRVYAVFARKADLPLPTTRLHELETLGVV